MGGGASGNHLNPIDGQNTRANSKRLSACIRTASVNRDTDSRLAGLHDRECFRVPSKTSIELYTLSDPTRLSNAHRRGGGNRAIRI
jgi:hypothetical protein